MQTEATHLASLLVEVNYNDHLLFLVLMGSDGMPVTGLASGRPANATEAYNHEFALTISTILDCDVPLQLSCEPNNNELNGSQWDAFRVSYMFLL